MASRSRRPPHGRILAGLSVKERMRRRLRTKTGRAVSETRKAIVEPVFGQITEARGFARVLLRGLVKVRGQWPSWPLCTTSVGCSPHDRACTRCSVCARVRKAPPLRVCGGLHKEGARDC